MSRSYKKHPFYTDGSPRTTKEMKKVANSKVRHTEDVPNGKKYKKIFCSYDIHDWITRWSWKEAKKEYETNEFYQKKYPTLKDFYKYWSKIYKRK